MDFTSDKSRCEEALARPYVKILHSVNQTIIQYLFGLVEFKGVEIGWSLLGNSAKTRPDTSTKPD